MTFAAHLDFLTRKHAVNITIYTETRKTLPTIGNSNYICITRYLSTKVNILQRSKQVVNASEKKPRSLVTANTIYSNDKRNQMRISFIEKHVLCHSFRVYQKKSPVNQKTNSNEVAGGSR